MALLQALHLILINVNEKWRKGEEKHKRGGGKVRGREEDGEKNKDREKAMRLIA